MRRAWRNGGHSASDQPLGEAECYERSYGEHVLHHVDVVRRGSSWEQNMLEIPWDADVSAHVSSETLKRQFEERLAARKRRNHRRPSR